MFYVYFHLYISLQASAILLRRFRRQRMVKWLRRHTTAEKRNVVHQEALGFL
jgi:hypothetical protein